MPERKTASPRRPWGGKKKKCVGTTTREVASIKFKAHVGTRTHPPMERTEKQGRTSRSERYSENRHLQKVDKRKPPKNSEVGFLEVTTALP